MNNSWEILKKELNYYGVNLIDNKRCQIYKDNNIITQGIIKTIRQNKKRY